MKNKKNIIKGAILATIILAVASSALAAGGGYGQGQGRGGGGCMGDTACMEARQAERMNNPELAGQRMGQGQGPQSDHDSAELDSIKNSATLPLTDSDVKTLEQMREEEKLARDVYITLYQKWGTKVFDNISKSEEKHKEAVGVLIEKYNLNDPIKDDTVGVFTSTEMAKLYNDLVEKGSKSLVDALEVGATIEDLDIYDLEKAMAETDNADIIKVYTNLRNGSENHMRAFNRQLEANNGGETYKVQYISAERMQEILNGQNRNKANHQNSGGQNGGGVNYNPTLDSTAMADNTYQAQEESFFAKVWRWMFGWL